jgi:hypothetical protein
MCFPRKVALLVLVGVFAAGSLVFALAASGGSRDHGDHEGKALFRSRLAPSVPTDPTFHGIVAGGDARIEAKITLPANCLAPIVVVHPNGNPGAYIAISGWKS